MFSQLYGWLTGEPTPTTHQTPSSPQPDSPTDDWVLIDKTYLLTDEPTLGDSWLAPPSPTPSSSSSDSDDDANVIIVEEAPDRVLVVDRSRFANAPLLIHRINNATGSLPARLDESWFLTPPPCFISTGPPVQMATSPLENLLIEHPSMSVYNHHTLRTYEAVDSEGEEEEEEAVIEEEEGEEEEIVVVRRAASPRLHQHHQQVQQEERQGLQRKQAQKVQIQNAAKAFKRGHMDRTNKAREVNCRNRRQRRGERSQGAQRSNANNNRKC